MNGGSQPLPGKYQKQQQKERQNRRKRSLQKSQVPKKPTHKNLVELQKKREALEKFCEQAKLETQEEKECRNELE
jgi:hypothetical protein